MRAAAASAAWGLGPAPRVFLTPNPPRRSRSASRTIRTGTWSSRTPRMGRSRSGPPLEAWSARVACVGAGVPWNRISSFVAPSLATAVRTRGMYVMMNVMMILSQLREHTRRGPPSQPSVRLLNLGAALGFALCASSCSNFRRCSGGSTATCSAVKLTPRNSPKRLHPAQGGRCRRGGTPLGPGAPDPRRCILRGRRGKRGSLIIV